MTPLLPQATRTYYDSPPSLTDTKDILLLPPHSEAIPSPSLPSTLTLMLPHCHPPTTAYLLEERVGVPSPCPRPSGPVLSTLPKNI